MFQQELIYSSGVPDRLEAYKYIFSLTLRQIGEIENSMKTQLDVGGNIYETKIYHGCTHNRETAGTASMGFHQLMTLTGFAEKLTPDQYATLRLNLGIASVRHDLPFRSTYKHPDSHTPTPSYTNLKHNLYLKVNERVSARRANLIFSYSLNGDSITSEEASALNLIALLKKIDTSRQSHRLPLLFNFHDYSQIFNVLMGTYVTWDPDFQTVRPVHLDRLIEHGITSFEELPNIFPDTKYLLGNPYGLPLLMMLSAHIGDLGHATFAPEYFLYTCQKLAWENLVNNLPEISVPLKGYSFLSNEEKIRIQRYILDYTKQFLENQHKFVLGRQILTTELIERLGFLGSNATAYLSSLNSSGDQTRILISGLSSIINNMTFDDFIRFQASQNILTKISE